MVMRHKRFVFLGGLAGGVALLALAASPARSQDQTAGDLACTVFEELINSGNGFCLDEDCSPSEKDCDKVCANATKTCNAVSRESAQLAEEVVKAEVKQQKTLCKTASDAKSCKSSSKSFQKDGKMATQQFRKDAKQACGAGTLTGGCLDACNAGLVCSCDGPDLLCGL
jgi:hypothetical protein